MSTNPPSNSNAHLLDPQHLILRESAPSSLFVASTQVADRHAHEIGFYDAGSRHSLLTSIEGTDQQDWPASPALQQVYQQHVDSDPVILAVGMAGNSHFSMSAKIMGAAGENVLIEMACLIKKGTDLPADAFLGTTYQLSLIHI